MSNQLNSRNIFLILLIAVTTYFYYFVITVDSSQSLFEEKINKKNSSQLRHMVIHSAFYYNTSKLYANNTMIILFNAHTKFLSYNIALFCYSKNETANLTSSVLVRSGDSSGPFCLWQSYFANCSTVENPLYFGLMNVNDSSIQEINFEYPEEKKYPVVMCYPQMVYESRWQQIIFATEIYRHFGADLQIQYINSAMTQIVDILEIYEKKGWIKIRHFAYLDFDAAMLSLIGYHPMLELDSRNQALAYTDCLMKYRESSDFVIVADVDEILIPKMPTYNQEFLKWSKLFQNSSAFMYYRVDGNIEAATNFDTFSLAKMLSSYKVHNHTYVGKSVYQTKYAEMAWIHWPGFDNTTTATIPPSNGTIYHTNLLNDRIDVNTFAKKAHSISDKDVSKIIMNFSLSFKNFPSFKSNNHYADAISKCYDETLPNWEKLYPTKKRPCLSPLQCQKPKILKGFTCKIVKRNFSTIFLNNSIVMHIPNSNYYWRTSSNGCHIFVNEN